MISPVFTDPPKETRPDVKAAPWTRRVRARGTPAPFKYSAWLRRKVHPRQVEKARSVPSARRKSRPRGSFPPAFQRIASFISNRPLARRRSEDIAPAAGRRRYVAAERADVCAFGTGDRQAVRAFLSVFKSYACLNPSRICQRFCPPGQGGKALATHAYGRVGGFALFSAKTGQHL